MAWSRYRNYHGVLDEDVLEKIADSVRSSFASDKASVVMGSHMLSADHLPEAFRDVRGLRTDATSQSRRGLQHQGLSA